MRDDAILSVVVGDGARTHGERLPAEIAAALTQAGVVAKDLDLLAVASGPGAFTGLRIGLAAVQGLAMVLGTPVVGVSALHALALAARESDITATVIASWMDAQRGEVFAARFSGGTADVIPSALDTPTAARPEDVLKDLPGATSGAIFIGDGAVRYRDEILAATAGAGVVLGALEALAPFIARIGLVLANQGHAGPPHALQPLYVRRSDAELERSRRTPA